MIIVNVLFVAHIKSSTHTFLPLFLWTFRTNQFFATDNIDVCHDSFSTVVFMQLIFMKLVHSTQKWWQKYGHKTHQFESSKELTKPNNWNNITLFWKIKGMATACQIVLKLEVVNVKFKAYLEYVSGWIFYIIEYKFCKNTQIHSSSPSSFKQNNTF